MLERTAFCKSFRAIPLARKLGLLVKSRLQHWLELWMDLRTSRRRSSDPTDGDGSRIMLGEGRWFVTVSMGAEP